MASRDKQKIIKATEKFAKNLLGLEGGGHDFWHVDRVRKTALKIAKEEKANLFIVELAVLLHDVGDYKVIGKDEDDYTIAQNWLIKQKVDQVVVDEVMYIIENMSFRHSFNKKKFKFSKEFAVVQDADRLDGIGAIGIARAFAYGGKKGRLLYNPLQNPRLIKNSSGYSKGAHSTIDHFYEKLLLLKNLMNTKTGKKIATSRHEFMEEFLERFYNESEGKA